MKTLRLVLPGRPRLSLWECCAISICLLSLGCNEDKQAADQNVPSSDEALLPAVADPLPVDLRVVDWTLRRGNWFVDGLRLSEGSDVRARATLMGSDGLVVGTEGGAPGYFGTLLEMRIHRAEDPSTSHVEVSGSWYTDVGPPFEGAIDILGGEVVLNTLSWQVGGSVQVLFELHGTHEHDDAWCAYGQVLADIETK